ncbi:MAG: type II toxin-antitoxin system Phd/YefM family antitoxin [Deltaproteobacteria bacterium]|nr:MAG: type II toxin-antitoxin system Phd/YefM family antitoxin [Deltaproteobacteria bacterium]
MIKSNIREVKAKLSAYLSRVEQGEKIMIVRRGKSVAILEPAEHAVPLPSLKEFRQQISMKGLPASETIIRMRKESRY